MNHFNDMEDDLPFGPTAPAETPTTIAKEVIEELFWQPCRKCGGSGQYRGFGTCFTCKGKGGANFKQPPEQRAKRRQQVAQGKVDKRAANLQRFAEQYPAEWQWMHGNNFGFAIAMVQAVEQYGNLKDGQLAAVRRCVDRQAASKVEAEARVANAPQVTLAPVEAAFASAIGKGIRSPKLNLDTFQLKPAKAGSSNAGAIYVTEQGAYLGKVMDGKFLRARECNDEQQARIIAAAADPMAAAVAYGKRFGQCSVCRRELTKGESIDRGIGPICAERFGW